MTAKLLEFRISEQNPLLSRKPMQSAYSGRVQVLPLNDRTSGKTVSFANSSFTAAYQLWIASRVSLAPATRKDYEKNYQRMVAFFGEKRLADITVADITQYRTLRQATVGPNRINKELNMLAQMLKKAGLWDEIGKWYERLPEAKTPVGIALEPEEEAHLFSVAATRSRWRVAYLAGVLSRNTGAGPGEIRQLTLSNIDCVDYAWIRIVRGLKNRCRLRVLDCNQDARWALAGLRERAERQGAYLPEHYLLPARGPDPTKPMTHWHKAWWALRKEAGKKYPRLLHVRLYDMRHCCATALLANPHIPYNVIEAILGHQVNSDTKRLYDHVRTSAVKDAVDAICSNLPKPGDK